MTSIAIISQKGGAGKTTVALNLAVAFAERGERTLLVDLDAQGGIAQSLARADSVGLGLADVVFGRADVSAALTQTKLPALTLLGRGTLDPIDVVRFEEAVAGDALTGLRPIFAGYSRVLLDTPSGLGLVCRAALRVADFALIPVQAEPLAMRGLGQALRVIDYARQNDNPALEFLGCVQTMAARETEASLAVMTELWSAFPGVLDTVIPRHPIFGTASLEGVPVAFLGGPVSPEATRFSLLAAEVDALLASKSGGSHAIQERRTLL